MGTSLYWGWTLKKPNILIKILTSFLAVNWDKTIHRCDEQKAKEGRTLHSPLAFVMPERGEKLTLAVPCKKQEPTQRSANPDHSVRRWRRTMCHCFDKWDRDLNHMEKMWLSFVWNSGTKFTTSVFSQLLEHCYCHHTPQQETMEEEKAD